MATKTNIDTLEKMKFYNFSVFANNLTENDLKRINAIKENIKSFKELISESDYKKYFQNRWNYYQDIREDYVRDIAWWLLTKKNIDLLSNILKNKKVLSIGSGLGYGEKWIEKVGKNIKFIITDKGNSRFFNSKLPNWVKKIDGESALEKYQSEVDVVFLAWPPYNSDLAYNVLMNLDKNKPLIVIGEGIGGCTANDDFWLELENKRKYDVKEIYYFDSFQGIHDYITIITKI